MTSIEAFYVLVLMAASAAVGFCAGASWELENTREFACKTGLGEYILIDGGPSTKFVWKTAKEEE